MGFRDRMKGQRKALKSRHNAQGQKAGTGGRYLTVFNKKKIPPGIGFFSCKEGTHVVDILPWAVGKNMPFDENDQPVTEKGNLDYVLDIWVHQNVGPTSKPFVCPYENFGLPCPICEYIKANRLPKEEWSKKRAKRRSIYLIWDHTTAEEEKKGVQIFDAAFFFMEEKLAEIAKNPEDGGYESFSDYETGKSVAWTRKGSGQENTQYLGHRFIERKKKIPDRILDKTFALDMVVKMHPSYEDIAKEFGSQEAPEEDDEPMDDIDDSTFNEPKKKKRKKTTDRKSGKSSSDTSGKKKKRKKVR